MDIMPHSTQQVFTIGYAPAGKVPVTTKKFVKIEAMNITDAVATFDVNVACGACDRTGVSLAGAVLLQVAVEIREYDTYCDWVSPRVAISRFK